jgi:hypothetical protein
MPSGDYQVFESAIADAGLLAVSLIFVAFWMLVVMVILQD